MTMNFNNENRQAADTLILIVLIAFMMAFLTSCSNKGMTREDFDKLSYSEAAQLRQDARMKTYRQSYRKRNRRRVWRTYPSYYHPYANPYRSYNRTKVWNKVMYSNTWK